MRCPKCGSCNMYIVDSRSDDTTVRRRRECSDCGHRYSTLEITETEYTFLKHQLVDNESVKHRLSKANSI